MTSFSAEFLSAIKQVADKISTERIEKIAEGLARLRSSKGRLFFLGVGGSAGNCGHAVNDFRKICGIET